MSPSLSPPKEGEVEKIWGHQWHTFLALAVFSWAIAWPYLHPPPAAFLLPADHSQVSIWTGLKVSPGAQLLLSLPWASEHRAAWVCVTEPSQPGTCKPSCMADTIPSPVLIPELCLGTSVDWRSPNLALDTFKDVSAGVIKSQGPDHSWHLATGKDWRRTRKASGGHRSYNHYHCPKLHNYQRPVNLSYL